MKWFSEDMPKYVQAKEYIDTAIVPLQQFHLTDEANLEKDAFLHDVLSIYANEIDKELSVCVLFTQNVHYLIIYKTKIINIKIIKNKKYVTKQQFKIKDETKLEKDSFQREVLTIYENEIEKELSGRILLTPTYHYLKVENMNMENEVERLNEWI